MLYSEITIRTDFVRRDLQMAAERVRHRVGPGNSANRCAAHAHDGFPHRPPIEHRVEIDDAAHVGERHAQGAAHCRSHRFGEPAIEPLRGVQCGQERAAPLRRQFGEDRGQAS